MAAPSAHIKSSGLRAYPAPGRPDAPPFTRAVPARTVPASRPGACAPGRARPRGNSARFRKALEVWWTCADAFLMNPQYCCRCGVLTEDPVLVEAVHSASGPGLDIYACRDHTFRVPAALTPAAALESALRGSHGNG
ncbi:hypothetical protein AB852_26335 [Streptomyces uncialis]|uniref:Uncharacterized protein n=2 Tax=Streptomyces uncialis TaxID=1048205 RepID=A0A1Q4V1V4_9ACTN|nr:hypothetical protein AB852_26335 [Streptomyces uncialis]